MKYILFTLKREIEPIKCDPAHFESRQFFSFIFLFKLFWEGLGAYFPWDSNKFFSKFLHNSMQFLYKIGLLIFIFIKILILKHRMPKNYIKKEKEKRKHCQRDHFIFFWHLSFSELSLPSGIYFFGFSVCPFLRLCSGQDFMESKSWHPPGIIYKEISCDWMTV